jgi:hypothetical protein
VSTWEVDLIRRWHGVIGFVLTLGVLAFLAYHLDLPALGRALAGAQYVYVLPLLGTTVILYGVGALQWQLVLRPVQWVRPLRLFRAQMVGALAQGLLYLPVGGLVRAYVVARRERASLSAVLATTLVDRLVDGFAFLGLVGVVLAFTGLPVGATPAQAALRVAGWTSLGLYLGLAALVAVLGAFPAQGATIVARVLGVLTPRWSQPAAALYARFCQGLGVPRRWRERSLLAVYAMGKKAIIPWQVYWMARAFSLDLPWTAYLFQVVFLGFLVFLAGSLGLRGTYQAGMVVALGFYGVSKEVALAIAVIVEVVSHGAAMALGLVCLWLEGVTLDELRALRARWQGSP